MTLPEALKTYEEVAGSDSPGASFRRYAVKRCTSGVARLVVRPVSSTISLAYRRERGNMGSRSPLLSAMEKT